MFSHVTVGSSDLQRSGAFYDALLAPLGLRQRAVAADGGPRALSWERPNHPLPRFYVYMPFDGEPATAGNGCMVTFLAQSPAAVDTAYRDGLGAGGTSEGEPGERARYGAGYYGAYLRDPDGNKVHVVHRGDLRP